MELPKLAVGTVSQEAINSVFQYSSAKKIPLALISSLGQIDSPRGYVNNWSTEDYFKYINRYKEEKIYPNANITICRDHLGPGFETLQGLPSFFAKLVHDARFPFDIIHLDMSHVDTTEQLNVLKESLNIAIDINPKLQFEIGFEPHRLLTSLKDSGDITSILYNVKSTLDIVCSIRKPIYFTCNTGSYVLRHQQEGTFAYNYCAKIKKILEQYNVAFKEHNADYLTATEIKQRVGIIDTMNIAPQIGAVQTNCILNACLQYGIPTTNFNHIVWMGRKWVKWDKNRWLERDDHTASVIIAGHYHYTSCSWKEIIALLRVCYGIPPDVTHEPFYGPTYLMQNAITKVIDHYVTNFK